jgi:hypothetical protein
LKFALRLARTTKSDAGGDEVMACCVLLVVSPTGSLEQDQSSPTTAVVEEIPSASLRSFVIRPTFPERKTALQLLCYRESTAREIPESEIRRRDYDDCRFSLRVRLRRSLRVSSCANESLKLRHGRARAVARHFDGFGG